jgi:hypothetical protein
MRVLQAMDIAMCLSHDHAFFNFGTTEQIKRIAVGIVPRRIAILWQPYEGAVCLRPEEITGYRKDG